MKRKRQHMDLDEDLLVQMVQKNQNKTIIGLIY
jgi:hypothetical protein